MRKPTLADVVLASEDESAGPCAVCGDEIEQGTRVVWVPAGYGPKNLLTVVHLHCAVKGDEIELVP